MTSSPTVAIPKQKRPRKLAHLRGKKPPQKKRDPELVKRLNEHTLRKRQNPEQYRQWKEHIDQFYRKQVWPEGKRAASEPDPEVLPEIATQESSCRSVIHDPVLPSKTLWHYHYYDAKARKQDREKDAKRLEALMHERKEQRKRLDEEHRQRLLKFAKQGLRRKLDNVVAHK